MLKQIKSAITILTAVIMGVIFTPPVHGADQTVKEIHKQYQETSDPARRMEVLIELSKTEPREPDDVNELRAIFSKKDYDEQLFEAAIESAKQVKHKKLDMVLIEILKDEKPFAEKAAKKDSQGKTEGELKRREMNIMFVMGKLGQMKSQSAVPVLKEYLEYAGFNYYASQALAMIGDTSAGEQIRKKAYEGEDVNYGGQGLDEALAVIRDLEDQSKKDKWPKIAKQIIHIKDPKAKPLLKRLFNHEVMDVRWEAAAKFRAMVDENDVPTIIEMTKNRDDIIRIEAIHAMKNLRHIDFADELIVLLNDRDGDVRRSAAKALGYKKITRAVPYLEKTINDSVLRVREECYIALYILTGKKYDYKGKTQRIERIAEDEKRHPSFY